jgi:hypothetical protein
MLSIAVRSVLKVSPDLAFVLGCATTRLSSRALRSDLAVEFSDAPNHVSWTARQSQPQRRCIGRFL